MKKLMFFLFDVSALSFLCLPHNFIRDLAMLFWLHSMLFSLCCTNNFFLCSLIDLIIKVYSVNLCHAFQDSFAIADSCGTFVWVWQAV